MQLDREKLLAICQSPEEKALGPRLIDMAQKVYENHEPAVSPFLDPVGQRVAAEIWRHCFGLVFLFYGGYRQAERKRGVIMPDYFFRELVDPKLSAVEVKMKQATSHRDLLGSLMGLGLKREMVGDLLVTPQGGQAVLATEILPFVLSEWKEVGQTRVEVSEIDLEQLAVEPERVKLIESTVASMRLDSVASTGFSTSRSAMVREIKAKKVKVNWETVENPSHIVDVGDVLSIRGRGRVEVEALEGETKKGRLRIRVKRLQ